MKWHGAIGFGVTEETEPGIYTESLIERQYYGDVIKYNYRSQSSEHINDNFQINNSISIIADKFLSENFERMKYLEFLGVKWKISDIEVSYPRMTLNLGGIYNGDETRLTE